MDLRSRRVSPLAIAGIGGAVIAVLIGLALHPPRSGSGRSYPSSQGSAAVVDVVAVSCPDVARRVPGLPAAARSEVVRELATLESQIVDANLRIARYPEQAEAELDAVADQRLPVIARIIGVITSAGGTDPEALTELPACALGPIRASRNEALPTPADSIGADSGRGARKDKKPTLTVPTKTGGASADDDGQNAGDASGVGVAGRGGGGSADTGGGAEASADPSPAAPGRETPTVNCPDVASHLPSVPSGAAGEVSQNLAELNQQITDANTRLAELAVDPVDDPNFVQNTVLGPLKDQRVASIDRIAIAIGRYTTQPSNLAGLAPCLLNQ